jgi:transporter family protein
MDKTLVSILGGLGGMFGWGVSDFFANLSSGKIGHVKTFFWSQFVGMIFTLFLIPFFGLNIDFPFLFAVLLVIASFFYSAGYLFFYKAFEIGNVSVVSTTINLWAVFTMIFAFIFLGQRLTPIQLWGVLLIVGGITLVSINFNDLKSRQIKLLAGTKQALIASVLFGVFWNLSDIISEEIGWLSTTLFVKIGAILSLLLFSLFLNLKLRIPKVSSKTKFIIVLIGVLEAAAVASVNYGIMIGDVILVSPISSALTVVTISLAIIFLKERITKIQFMGISAAVVGIVFTAF